MFFLNRGKEVVEITKELRRLLNKEPQMENRCIMRAAIMGYELGPIQQFAVYNGRLKMSEGRLRGYEENAKLGMADLITQCRMMCLENGWNFDEIQKMGLDHLKERQKEFEMDGWAEGEPA